MDKIEFRTKWALVNYATSDKIDLYKVFSAAALPINSISISAVIHWASQNGYVYDSVALELTYSADAKGRLKVC